MRHAVFSKRNWAVKINKELLKYGWGANENMILGMISYLTGISKKLNRRTFFKNLNIS